MTRSVGRNISGLLLALVVGFASIAGLLPHHHDGETSSLCLSASSHDDNPDADKTPHGCCHVIRAASAVVTNLHRGIADLFFHSLSVEVPMPAELPASGLYAVYVEPERDDFVSSANGLRAPPCISAIPYTV